MTKQQHQEILDSIGVVRTDLVTMAVTIKERFDGVDGRLDKVEGRLDGVEGRLDKVEVKLGKVGGRLDKVEVKLGKVEGKLGSLEKTVAKNHVHLISHIDRVYDELSGRRSDVETARATPRARRRV
jgi:predicted nuclease with TOPRIM domain